MKKTVNSKVGFKGQPGERSGRWIVETAAPRLVGGPRYVICRCACGTRRILRIHDLRMGRTSSCGCLKREMSIAKMSRKATFRQWTAMWKRYRRDGGNRVCYRWSQFVNFINDMGLRPQGKRLALIDPDVDFGPGNCRWADRRSNNRKRRHSAVTQNLGKFHSFSCDCPFHRSGMRAPRKSFSCCTA